MSREFHVAVSGSDFNCGSFDKPFLTISKAAKEAQEGDTVIVHEGVYREWVKPERGGRNDFERITYKAADGEKVVIKGSEVIKNWEKVCGTVYKTVIKNSFFGDYNPYKEILKGDWLDHKKGISRHPGEIYLNGKSFYEADSLYEVKNPEKRYWVHGLKWSVEDEKILHPEDTVYRWFCETDSENTTIYANFNGADPNRELVEINVRKCCFFPQKTHLNYITVKGFEMAQAATPWAPPTAEQFGLLGAHWSKGWIIEDNIIHDSKCSGISLGKEESSGQNLSTRTHRKSGYQYQMEAVFIAYKNGWSKEKIGSHLVRNNIIHDCGQNGIVGHMGGAFSEIYNNDIYNIGVKHEFFGYEIAGIKLHAAIDTEIHNNRIHRCTLGTWLDWQAQGTHVSKNLYYDNDMDIMVEVSHGPYLIENNVFGSKYNFQNNSQGGAYVNNLCLGRTDLCKILDRSTPYHFAHSTDIAGTAYVYGGDDRFCNNLFVGGKDVINCGTALYNDNPASFEEYHEKMCADDGNETDLDVKEQFAEAVYISSNAYLNGACGYNREKDAYKKDTDPCVKITDCDDGVYLDIDLTEDIFDVKTEIASTATLGSVRIVEAVFDDKNGNAITLDRDYFGNKRKEKPIVGPFENLKAGHNHIKIWG